MNAGDFTFEERVAGLLPSLRKLAVSHDDLERVVGPAEMDQLDAAHAETFASFAATAAVNRDMGVVQANPDVSLVTAMTLAAISGFSWCDHLRATPIQPLYVVLAKYRVDCAQCAETRSVIAFDPADDDRCDWCGRHGIETFQPMIYHLGWMLVVGDACETCAEALTTAGVST